MHTLFGGHAWHYGGVQANTFKTHLRDFFSNILLTSLTSRLRLPVALAGTQAASAAVCVIRQAGYHWRASKSLLWTHMFSVRLSTPCLRNLQSLSHPCHATQLVEKCKVKSRQISRFPHKAPGTRRRLRRQPVSAGKERSEDLVIEEKLEEPRSSQQPLEKEPTVVTSPLWDESYKRPTGSPQEGLAKLLSNDILIVTR